MRVGVIDYGVGNLGSVMQALEELRVTPFLVTRAIDMHTADSLILPGVGNFADCAGSLDEGGWTQALRDEVQVAGKPLLGICVGMQLLASTSMEGAADNSTNSTPGLGFIPGRVENLRTLGCGLRIPHVGWNEVTSHTTSGGLFDYIPDGTDFYFVHSYAFVPDDPAHVLATTVYDISVTAAVRNGHVWGTQFHPEKSSRAGFRLLRNFIENPIC
jgi:imidazole glycerol-phosphate synthase subunit HisH